MNDKMTKRELILFILMSVCSGLMIGIGGTASLLALDLFGTWGKLIGGILFSLGIYAIVSYEMRLFTGMVASIPKMGFKNCWKLPLCFLGNVIGVAFIALLVSCTSLGESAMTQAEILVEKKLSTENWGLAGVCSGILCGALITLSVWSVNYAPKKNLSATVGVMFPIIVFAFCGFDHSVANILYFCFAKALTWKALGFELCCILGNILGGIILPYISLLKEKSNAQKTDEPSKK